MDVKSLKKLSNEMYNILSRDEEVSKALEFETQVYIEDVAEGEKHQVFVLTKRTQLSATLQENGFTNNAIINELAINKQTKSVHGAF